MCYDSNVEDLFRGKLIKQRDSFRAHGAGGMDRGRAAQIEHDFAALERLVHGQKLLDVHGFGAFLQFLEELRDKNFARELCRGPIYAEELLPLVRR